jgi:drug/metabolite transporter (DMT)-like permease
MGPVRSPSLHLLNRSDHAKRRVPAEPPHPALDSAHDLRGALTTAQFAVGATLVLPIWALTWLTGTAPVAPRHPGPVAALLITGSLLATAFLSYAWALARVSATVSATAAALTLIPCPP